MTYPPNDPRPYQPQPYRPEPYHPGNQVALPAYAANVPPPQPPHLVMVPAGMNVDPATGLPLSDKSKITAGILQLLLGFLFGLGGVGRLYAGHTTLGLVQLGTTLLGWMSFWCGFFTIAFVVGFIPLMLYGGIWLWFVIDGIILLTGRPVDGEGRLLRS